MDIKKLIKEKQPETDWIDYKREWHKNKVSLLRDILAFVNTPHTKDCFLVIGVEDKTFDLFDVSSDENRKNNQQMINFLNDKNFSNEMPKIDVSTLFIDDIEIDVIKIKNTSNVPLYLTEDLRYQDECIKGGQIFTRVGDVNTAKDKTATDYQIESLYKKRFHLSESIHQRYDYLLEQTDDWTYIDSEGKLLYKYDPNFYIMITPLDAEEENSRIKSGDYYSWLVESSTFPYEWEINHYHNVYLMYGQHQIYSLKFLFSFDRAMGYLTSPNTGYLKYSDLKYSYNYILQNSREWKFMNLLECSWNNVMGEDFQMHHYSNSEALENIVLYRNEEEKEYVESHYDYSTTYEMLEKDFGMKIKPSDEEIIDLQKKNKEYGEASILRNNISKGINKKLKELEDFN